jgi:protein-tyrosine phosphatase
MSSPTPADSAATAPIRVLFVCLGNICRSPMAEGVFRHQVEAAGLADRVHIDSAGTHAYHIDEPPDPRAQSTAAQYGADIGGLRGRQVTLRDIEEYHYVLAMDNENLANLRKLAPVEHHHKIRLFLEYANDRPEEEVPDPYFGGISGFHRVLDLIDVASAGLLDDLCSRHVPDARRMR